MSTSLARYPTPSKSHTPPRKFLLPLLILVISLLLLPLLSYQNPPLLLPESNIQTTTGGGSRTALVLTAHPDDEVMFFAPVILGLVGMDWQVSGLCISSGNATGLGDIRSQELFASYETLGIPNDKVTLANHPLLQDGDEEWDPAILTNIVSRHLTKNPVSLLITFDRKGITNHPNHTPLSLIHPLLPNKSPRLLVLRSPSTLTKFTGPLYAMYHILRRLISPYFSLDLSLPDSLKFLQPYLDGFGRWTRGGDENVVMISGLGGYVMAIKAMLCHRSQLVWFRWLYLAFSRLMWINELVLVGP